MEEREELEKAQEEEVQEAMSPDRRSDVEEREKGSGSPQSGAEEGERSD